MFRVGFGGYVKREGNVNGGLRRRHTAMSGICIYVRLAWAFWDVFLERLH